MLARQAGRRTSLARWRSPLVGALALVMAVVVLRFVGKI
jgi:hypothetical protein